MGELSLEGKSGLEATLDERCAYRCHGGARAEAGEMLGGRCVGPNGFCRLSVLWGRVLFSGAVLGVKSGEALRSCPGVTASGYSFTGAPGMSWGCWARRWRAGLLPEGQISGRDKAESKQKDRQIGRCCGGRTQRVVLGS